MRNLLTCGKRDRFITLESLVVEKKGGVAKDSWQVIGTAWASKLELRGNERFVNGRDVADAEREYRTLWSDELKGLTPADRLIDGDLKFDIVSVQEIGREQGLSIKCKLRDASNA